MNKFQRNYIFQVQANTNLQQDFFVVVKPPFTIEFDITRTLLTSGSRATFRVLNLNPDTRNRILKDEFDYDNVKRVLFNAGYGDGPSFPLCFSGNVTKAFSHREKNVFVTQIECDGGMFAYTNSKYNQQFPELTEQRTIVESMVKSLSPFGVTAGAIGNITGKLSRGNMYSGNAIDLLNALNPGAVFIDNQKINVLANDECLDGDVLQIDASTGLLGTPIREQTYLLFDILFEPTVQIGQQVKINSQTAQNFNGYYKVVSVQHKGTISETVCGDATTKVGVFYGSKSLKLIAQQT